MRAASACSKSATDMPGARSTVAVVGAQVARPGQSGRLGAVGNDELDTRVELTGEAGARDRGHVRSASGYEDGEPERRAGAHSSMYDAARSGAYLADDLRALAARVQELGGRRGALLAGTMTTMPMPQLKVRYISAESVRAMCCNQSNTGSRGQARALEHRLQARRTARAGCCR